MSLDNELEIFRENFYSVNVFVENGYMVYRTRKGFAKMVAQEANKLIEKLGLNLVAIPSSLSSKDSFHVQSNLTEV